ncbi:MAG: M48 family metallopeptidase, partial [Myxococcota bacterium]
MDEKSRRRAKLGTILAGCLFVFFLSIRFIAPLFASALPASWLDEIGSELVTEVGKENGGFCNEEAGLDALKKMAQAIADESKTDIEFKVHVSNADVFNAFAAPGDYIVLYKPIIEEAESPNEVAGVLAHEMAHLVEKHPAEGVAEAIGYTLFSLINPVGDSFGSSLGKSLLTNAHSRSDELDADRVG